MGKNGASKVAPAPTTLIGILRQMVKPPGKVPSWLNKLTDLQLLEVFRRLRADNPAYGITSMCQQEWGYCRNSDVRSLARSMRIFKQKIEDEQDRINEAIALEESRPDKRLADAGTKPLYTPVLSSLVPPEASAPPPAVTGDEDILSLRPIRTGKNEPLDVLAFSTWLVELQAERIVMLHKLERKSMPFRWASQEIAEMGRLLGQVAKLQMDLGLVERVPGELNINQRNTYEFLMHGMGGDGKRAAGAIQNFLEWADRNAISMKYDPVTNEYIPVQEGERNAGPRTAEQIPAPKTG